MRRNLTFEEISDGHKYGATDCVSLPANECAGCHECCTTTDDTIHLDPYDIFELSKGLSLSFDGMIDKVISLKVVDGVITPFLLKASDTGNCTFLDENGRCGIHNFRPGFCRLFPLGRIYEEDGGFNYYLQVHECPYKDTCPQTVKSWLNIPRLDSYEAYIRTWHEITVNIRECAEFGNERLLRQANLRLLNLFFSRPYDLNSDFFSQFGERCREFMQ